MPHFVERRKVSWEVIFDGIGSQIAGVIIGALLSAAISVPISYKAGKKSVIQKQKASNNAIQTQIGISNDR